MNMFPTGHCRLLWQNFSRDISRISAVFPETNLQRWRPNRGSSAVFSTAASVRRSNYKEPVNGRRRRQVSGYHTRSHRNQEESSQNPATVSASELSLTSGTAPYDPTVKFTSQGMKYSFHSIFLRDSCTCTKCIDPSSKQRNFRTSDIPLDISASEVIVDENQLIVKWKHDIPGYGPEHQSCFPAENLPTLWLCGWKKCYPGRGRVAWDRETFTQSGNWTDFRDYIHDDRIFAQAMGLLYDHGLIFVKNVPGSEQAIEQIAQRIGPIRNTFYGPTWNVRSVQDAKNVAYTNHHLGFHMDLLYMNEPPGIQLLHTLRNSCIGGESQFADSYFAALRLKESHRHHFDELCKFLVTFEYHNDGHHYRRLRPTIQLAGKQIAYINWSPPFQGKMPLGARMKLDGQGGRTFNESARHGIKPLQAFVEAAKVFSQELEREDMVYEFKMEPGTCAIFQNRRVVHARKAFDTGSGERWLKGAYVDEDAFLSTVQTLADTTSYRLRTR